MALLDYLVAFIPMLGILIFVHELGHFLVAKACGVRILKFSLGFGPAIGFGNFRLRWERGGTEYVIAWIPLGGFVKMLGENLEVQGEEPDAAAIGARPDEFLDAKATWQKLSISFAGPAMNLAFPVAVLVVGLMIGMPRAATRIGTVDIGSPAALAGLEPGDRILAIDGESMRFWDDVEEQIRSTAAGELTITAERNGEPFDAAVSVIARSGLNVLGKTEQRGWIGVQNQRLQPLVGVPDADSPAALAGLRSGDLVVGVGDEEIGDWNEFVRAVGAGAGAPLAIDIERGADPVQRLELELPAAEGLDGLGIVPATVLITEVSVPSAAHDAGLVPGDLLLEVDGRSIGSFGSFAETVRSSEGRELRLRFARDGELHMVGVAPRLVTRKGELAGIEEELYQIGVRPHVGSLEGEYETEKYSNPIAALPRAVQLTLDITGTFLRGLGMLLTGEVDTNSLTGPIGIAQIARDSLDRGWWAYFGMMMLISINLGILNLLPIPVLDGGQALIYIVEGVKRSPISLRSRELVQSFGLAVLVMLMGLALWNDLARNWSVFVDWLTGGL
ncbi:MAG: RIP metalloprotease RseP [Myxococcota bacterium]|nr:RIP metalloprotease RseP [Myxococcota bacterium]